MDLLVSVVDAGEAAAALAGGASIVDVKNPAEGALGAADLGALLALRAALPAAVPLSVALGDSTSQPGQIALAAYAAASLGAGYVKIALRGPDADEALAVLRAARRGAEAARPGCALIAVGYADAARVGALDWRALPELAAAAGASGCLLDTAVKDGRGLLACCDEPGLAAWLRACAARGLRTALAGALRAADLPAIRRLGPDIVGVRSAACAGDRVRGRVEAARVALLRSLI
jgi:(5-formylfuran-3-yl)methyl phosphate synthase